MTYRAKSIAVVQAAEMLGEAKLMTLLGGWCWSRAPAIEAGAVLTTDVLFGDKLYALRVAGTLEYDCTFVRDAANKFKLKGASADIPWPKSKITWNKDDFGSLITGDNP